MKRPLLALASFCVLGGCARRPLPPVARDKDVVFRIHAPQAKQVTLLGDFDGWEPVPLSGPDSRGIWSVALALAPGRFAYAFSIDGVLVDPPDAPRHEVDDFGGRHGVVKVPEDL